jgi:hypothetical protein
MKAELKRKRRGSLLINSMILMMVLLLTGSAFLKWAVGETGQSTYDLAKTQAYYLAQKGAVTEGLTYIQNKTLADIRDWGETFPPTSWAKYPSSTSPMFQGKFEESHLIVQMVNLGGGEELEEIQSGKYNLVFTAAVKMPQNNGKEIVARSTANIQLQRRTFANYMYLTNCETTAFPGQDPWDESEGEVINFWSRDTLDGRVHSNGTFAMMQRPVFRGPVSTSMEEINLTVGAAPQFSFEPIYEAPIVNFPDSAYTIRVAAMSSGTFFTDNAGGWESRITARAGGFHLEQWVDGGIYTEDAVVNEATVPYGLNRVIFVEGKLEVIGDLVAGKSTIASGGDMRLIGDIVYEDFNWPELAIDPDSRNILGLVSESNIVVANTVKNGLGNGNSIGGALQHENKHIVITAGMVALGVCFEFQNQNDDPALTGGDPNGYYWCDPAGDHAGERDERGIIYLRGAIAMRRRGYVHRGINNCGGTGYGKSYHYDFRLQTDPPPIYLVAEDGNGNTIFDITDSWESDPDEENFMRKRPSTEY